MGDGAAVVQQVTAGPGAARIGNPESLITRATARASHDWGFIGEAITAAAKRGGAAAVPAALNDLKGDPRIERPLLEPGVLANLAGQLHVRLVEMHKRVHLLSEVRGRFHDRVWALDDDSRPAFLSMSFDEALDFWKRKGGDPQILADVLRAYRAQAALSGDTMLDTISARAVAQIESTLASGGTLQDFVDAVRDGGTAELASPISDDYLDLVFRTNVLGAYGAGRFKQLSDPDVIAARPYRVGHTVEDERVREEHAPIDGVIWRALNAIFAHVMAPFGFRCRCGVSSMDDEELRDSGGVVSEQLPDGFVITPGFGAGAFAFSSIDRCTHERLFRLAA